MFLQTFPLDRRLRSLFPLLFIFPSPPTSVFIPLSVFDSSKSPHLSFINTHFLSLHAHTQKNRVNAFIVSCPPELLSDYVKQKRVRKKADLNGGLIFLRLTIRLLSVSYHWGQRWSPTDSNTRRIPDTCGNCRPRSQRAQTLARLIHSHAKLKFMLVSVQPHPVLSPINLYRNKMRAQNHYINEGSSLFQSSSICRPVFLLGCANVAT